GTFSLSQRPACGGRGLEPARSPRSYRPPATGRDAQGTFVYRVTLRFAILDSGGGKNGPPCQTRCVNRCWVHSSPAAAWSRSCRMARRRARPAGRHWARWSRMLRQWAVCSPRWLPRSRRSPGLTPRRSRGCGLPSSSPALWKLKIRSSRRSDACRTTCSACSLKASGSCWSEQYRQGESMTPELAKEILASEAGSEDPILLPPGVFKHISIADVPEQTPIEVGVLKDGVHHI